MWRSLQLIVILMMGLLLSGCFSTEDTDTEDKVVAQGTMVQIEGKINLSSVSVLEKFQEIKSRKVYLSIPGLAVQNICTLIQDNETIRISGAHPVKEGVPVLLLVPDVRKENEWFTLELGVISTGNENQVYDFGTLQVETHAASCKLLSTVRGFNQIPGKFTFGDYTLPNMMLSLYPEIIASSENAVEGTYMFCDNPGDIYLNYSNINVSRLLKTTDADTRSGMIQKIGDFDFQPAFITKTLWYHPAVYTAACIKATSGIPVAVDIIADSRVESASTNLSTILSLYEYVDGNWTKVSGGTELLSAGWDNFVRYTPDNDSYKKMVLNFKMNVNTSGLYKLKIESLGEVEVFNNGVTIPVENSDELKWDSVEMLVYVTK